MYGSRDVRTQRAARLAQRTSGFTLVEIMVVLVILAVAISVVALSVSRTSGHGLESAAEQLSSSLEDARWQAIALGRRLAWEAPQRQASDEKNSIKSTWYEQLPDGVWVPKRVSDNAGIPDGVEVQMVQPGLSGLPSNTPQRLVFGAEPVSLPVCIRLSNESGALIIVSDGVAPFSVKRDARC